MSCCDGCKIGIYNYTALPVELSAISIPLGILYGVDYGTILAPGESLQASVESANHSDGQAQGTIRAAFQDYPQWYTDMEYHFTPANDLGLCPCVVTSVMSSNYNLLAGNSNTNQDGKGWSFVDFRIEVAGPPPPPTIDPQHWQEDAPQAGPWQVGNRFRYAACYYDQFGEWVYGGLVHWGDWITVGAYAYPTVVVPVDASGKAVGRRLYRQFEGYSQITLGDIDDNTTTDYVDTNDDFGQPG